MYRYELLGGNDQQQLRRSLFFLFLIALVLFGLLFQYSDDDKKPMVMCPDRVDYTSSTIVPEDSDDVTNSEKVWDTMDGQGYQFAKENEPIILDERFDKLNNLTLCGNLAAVEIKQDVFDRMANLRKEFLKCITPIVNKWKGKPKEMVLEWVSKAAVCDQLPVFESLGIVPFENLHETKWAILPKCKEENTLVTLGIGHDTIAEEKFNRTLPNTKFYGADPIIEPNRRMYSAFGKFFPFAIGRQPGFTKFRVLPNQNQKTRAYVFQDVTTIPFLYFVNEILKLKRIDFAWIDIEGGEFEFLDQLHKGVTICQFNIEVHQKFRKADGAQVFHEFIFKVLENQKYVFLKSLHTDVGVHRMFFVNVEDRECLAKFIR